MSTVLDNTGILSDQKAGKIIRRYMLWAAGAGLVPVPWVDMAALASVQVKMLHALAQNYKVPFSESGAKTAIGALVGSVLPGQAASGFLGGLIKMIPLVGFVVVPAFASTSTYALGKVFEQHFASGGTFLTFQPEAVRKYYSANLASAPAA